MGKKRLLSEVLWEAANVWLLPRKSHDGEPPLEYSCNAAQAAEARRYTRGMFMCREKSRAVKFLEELGCDANSVNLFAGQGDVQGARFMWLLLAMHVAADEGIEV